MKRRQALQAGLAVLALPAASLLNSCQARAEDAGLQVHYLEIVTPEVEKVCALYSQAHGVTFGPADESLGKARTAELASGGKLGVRAPLRPTEQSVVRPYMRVPDIQAAVAAAAKAGAEVAVPPMPVGSHGQCAIVVLGGIDFGYWQV